MKLEDMSVNTAYIVYMVNELASYSEGDIIYKNQSGNIASISKHQVFALTPKEIDDIKVAPWQGIVLPGDDLFLGLALPMDRLISHATPKRSGMTSGL